MFAQNKTVVGVWSKPVRGWMDLVATDLDSTGRGKLMRGDKTNQEEDTSINKRETDVK